MRLHSSRITAFVALIAALMTVSVAAPPRLGATPGRDRDRVLRISRGGPQRLDAAEGVAHAHDEHDLAPAPPGDSLLVTGTHASAQPHASTFHPAALPAALFSLPAQFVRTTLAVDGQPAPPRAWQRAYAPDRAPPQA